ncbi:MAG: CPXCG motif-containing cysteine-rich protein [Bdellovibrionota bacterium]
MISEQEISTQCPYCFSPIVVVCEPFSGTQTYVEDCEVCCKPIQISYRTDEDSNITEFSAKRLDE